MRDGAAERIKKTGVEGALERKRGDGASLPISRKREGADERNRGMSSRVRTCSLLHSTPLHTTGAISIRTKSVLSFLLLLALQDCETAATYAIEEEIVGAFERVLNVNIQFIIHFSYML